MRLLAAGSSGPRRRKTRPTPTAPAGLRSSGRVNRLVFHEKAWMKTDSVSGRDMKSLIAASRSFVADVGVGNQTYATSSSIAVLTASSLPSIRQIRCRLM